MNASRPSARDDARPRVPRSASVLGGAAVLVLLLPMVAALPDLPFGRWRPLWGAFLQVDAATLLFALPIFLLLGALSVAPVVLVAAALPGRPLAFWLGLAAYLAGGLAGFGATYRALAGDGLEYLPLHVFIGLAALLGAALGALIDPWLRRARARVAVVGVAMAAAVLGSLTWSVIDAAGFEAQRQAWRERRGLPAVPANPPDAASPRACLGRPSADGTIRLFTEDECTGELAGRWHPGGECLKPEGGSFSWDLRDQNARCPPGRGLRAPLTRIVTGTGEHSSRSGAVSAVPPPPANAASPAGRGRRSGPRRGPR